VLHCLACGRRTPEQADRRTDGRGAALWRDRFLALGVEGLLRDAPRSGRKPSITAETVAAVIAKTTQSTPQAATHWSRSNDSRYFHNDYLPELLVSAVRPCGVDARLAAQVRKEIGIWG
jgi:hypothetical protein